MGLIRLWVEDFLRGRIGYDGPSAASGVLVVAVLIGVLAIVVLRSAGPLLCVGTLVLLLLTLQVPRLALPLLVVAILGVILFGPGQQAAF